jgi:hypothetical protein
MPDAPVNDTSARRLRLRAEKERYAFADVTVAGLALNRGTAIVRIDGGMEGARLGCREAECT